MSFDDFANPADTGGEFVNPRQLDGHLLIVFPLGYVPFIQTKFSRPDKPSDGIAVDVVDLDDKDDHGMPGKVYRNCNWMQAQLIASLKSLVGQKVLGRIGLGVARNGMNPPWVLIPMSDDPAARERASAWVHANQNFVPTTFTLRAQAEQTYTQQPAQGGGGGGNYQGQQSQGGGYQGQQNSYQDRGGYQQPDQPRQQPTQQQASYGVAGAAPVSDEEQTLLAQFRAQRQQRQQQDAQGGFQQPDPPF